MQIEQIYTGCLAQGAYYIESDGEAAIIDPLRDARPYTDRAARDGARIRYVLETHFHADFVSGHTELADKTGAIIVYGSGAQPVFPAHITTDGEWLPLGKVRLKVLHTPGHTMESCCYLLHDETDQPVALFSGDTLFIGDVGRPDLAQKVNTTLTPELLAGHLYDSLRQKLMPLPDNIIVYPAHGSGSACGKKMSSETSDTLGHQKQTNYALQPGMDKETFIREVLDGLVEPPAYFPLNVLMNIKGATDMGSVMRRGRQAVSAAAFAALARETGALILDTRSAASFKAGFIPGAVFIGLDGPFATWVGTLITDIDQQILLVADPGKEEEAITRLARVGYDNCIGFLEGGFKAWLAAGMETDKIESVTAAELARLLHIHSLQMLDVRKYSEYNSEHVAGVGNVPLDFINEIPCPINDETACYVFCAGGYRSVIFNSILRARGYQRLVDVVGGFKAIKDSNFFTLTQYQKPTTLL
jgi:glyoxylase-like metal-dependent hydrolase (beta-lactamase superfamily II)/rhodanese-related sulfurtransferase